MNRFTDTDLKLLEKLRTKTINSCSKGCKDGWISEKGILGSCDCRKVFVYLKELVYARIPQEYWSLNLDSITIEPIVSKNEIKRYFKYFSTAIEKGLGFCLMGQNGVGKTSIMAEIGKISVLNGLLITYTTTQDYINSRMRNDDDETRRIEEESDVILLDEIDKPYKKKGSDYVPAQMENFLRNLLPKNKIVNIATNWSEEEIRKYFGDSVFSIMLRKLKFLSITGEDKSEYLQNDWDKRLSGDSSNFLSEYFISMARRMKRFKEED